MRHCTWSGGRSIRLALFAAATFACTPAAMAGGDSVVRSDPAAAPGVTAAQTTKLATDEPLRKSMAAIRTLVAHHHSLVTHRRLPPDMAIRFAVEARNLTEFIVANSKVAGEAADALAPLLGKINEGAEAIAGRKPEIDPMDGLFQIDEAIATYGARFDHPNWTAGR